jgi:formate dehydrogenase major subunit
MTVTSSASPSLDRARRLARPRKRLTTPYVRDDGELRPAGWDEALERAASGLQHVIDDHGPTAVGMFSCSKSTNEMNYAAQKFARTVLGTNNIDSCNRT